ncbi:MAG TPA: DNA polymerase III subunit alpha [Phycisphaerales bacterium]|nr:MAG: DNA polymerase III subunit alpha [Planctomycetes bacterium GWC2_45_44]HBG77740.1 DNA polymerase III subunit alpha [Phycisphaerales bacterium]HBR20400.1 DNA polymerase III subunit alpha [Phycisphaerales bacterium]
MSEKGFAHLHLHTQYSLLDGAIAPGKLFKRCKQMSMDSVAITDHGNMFGAIDFYLQARAAEIKPIIGLEAYVAPDSRFNKQKSSIADAAYHLILLAENNTGYKNLLKLASVGYTEGFYYRPRIDKEILAECSEGIICSTACLKGEVNFALSKNDGAWAKKAIEEYLKIFGEDRFFMEVQEHQPTDCPWVRQAVIDLARKMSLPLLAANDAHFLDADDYEAHDALTCLSTGKRVNEEGRMSYPRDVYVKSPDEMREMFRDVPDACDNTLLVAQRCNVEIDTKTRHAPSFKTPDKSTPEKFLTKLCYEGAKKRYGKMTDEIKQRLDHELEIIESKGFSSYFLIVWDFCRFAAENNIPTGARGSGVGTVVGYCLGLCDVDPIRYDLLFERFMDPQRNEMPDIDIDICQDGRAKVLEYVRSKYGHIAQIITFGTLKARGVIRDVCRVLDVPLAEADRLAKLVPTTLDITLETAMEQEPDLKKAYEQNPMTKRVIDIGKKLEGLTRHASVHACGVVIADEPLTNFVPLYRDTKSEDIITQFEGPLIDKIGLLKMDFLGLRTLSVIQRTIDLVAATHNVKIDIEKIDLTDPKVFEIFATGKTRGVFQFESGGMQDLLMRLKPDRIEDLIAANALYRPGPMALIGDFIERKHGVRWTVPHQIMKEVLEETFGIMVYQEQVMRICNRLGDIPLREAYTLIKAISKKQVSTISKQKEQFVKGCGEKGLDKHKADEIFELIERFAGYGFNKSHATRYSFIAFQTAYLKAYWPLEFMASLLTYERGDADKVAEYIGECRQMGIEVYPPDINESSNDFTVIYEEESKRKEGKGIIRFGLAAVKGVGEKAVEQIILAREKTSQFHSLFHFCENVDLRLANKQVIESLIKAGAYDRLGGSRAQMLAALEMAMKAGSDTQVDRANGQLGLFGAMETQKDYAKDHQRLPDVPAWPEAQMLAYEKEVLGLYVTKNPLSQHADTISVYSTANTAELSADKGGQTIVIGGMVQKIRNIVTRNGRNAGAKMAVFTIVDLQGTCEVVMWSDCFAVFGGMLAVDKVLFVKGRLDLTRETPQIICEELIDIEHAGAKLAANINILLNEIEITKEKIAHIKTICSAHRGKSPVYITVKTIAGVTVKAAAGKGLAVNPSTDFCRQMEYLVGAKNFRMSR